MNHNKKNRIGEDAVSTNPSTGSADPLDNTRRSGAFEPASLWVTSIDEGLLLSAWKNLLDIIWVTIASKGKWK